MDLNQLENKLKSTLEDHHSTVDTQLLWAAIEPQLEKKRRPIWLWLFQGIGCLGLTTILTYHYTNNDQIVALNNALQVPNNTWHHPNNLPSFVDPSLPKAVLADIFQETPTERTGKQSGTIPGQTQARPNTDSLTNHSHTNKATPEAMDPIASITPPFLTIPRKPLRSPKANLNISEIPQLPIRPLASRLSIDLTTLCYPDFNGRKLQLMSMTRVGIFALTRSLTDANGMDTSRYIRQRKTTEQSLEAFTAELLVQLKHRNGLYLNTGIQGIRINERFTTNEWLTESLIDSNVLKEIIIYPDGDVTFFTGVAPRQRTTITRRGFYNHYHLFNIPLNIGYEWSPGKWGVGLEGGITFNWKLAASGKISPPNPEQEPLDLSSGNILKSTLGMGYQGGIQVNVQLFPRTSLQLMGRYQRFPQSLTRNTFQVDQSYQLWGAQIGVIQKL